VLEPAIRRVLVHVPWLIFFIFIFFLSCDRGSLTPARHKLLLFESDEPPGFLQDLLIFLDHVTFPVWLGEVGGVSPRKAFDLLCKFRSLCLSLVYDVGQLFKMFFCNHLLILSLLIGFYIAQPAAPGKKKMVIFYDSSSFAGSSDSSSIITFWAEIPAARRVPLSLCIGHGLCVRAHCSCAWGCPSACACDCVLAHCFQHFKKLFLTPGQKPDFQ